MKGHSSLRFKTQTVASYHEKVRDCKDRTYILAAFKMGNKRRRVNYNGLVTTPDLKGGGVLFSSWGSAHVQSG